MYKLLRRISSSISGRFDRDRTQEGEASQAAPQTGSKRRMSDDDEEQNGSLSKRSRAHVGSANLDENGRKSESATPVAEETPAPTTTSASAPGLPRTNTEEVRQVTKGVKEVELEDKKGRDKEVLKEPSGDKAVEECSLNDGENEGDSEAAEEPTKSDEIPKTEEVVDGEPAADEAKEDKVSEVSDIDDPSSVAVASNAAATPLESLATPEEPADAVTDAQPSSELTPTTLPADDQASLPENVVEPPVSIAPTAPPMKA